MSLFLSRTKLRPAVGGARLKDDSGLILIVVMWVLLIVSFLAMGLAQTAAIELSRRRYLTGQVKSKYIAWAGFMYALNRLRQDTRDELTSGFDSLNQCGIKLSEEESVRGIFEHIPVGEGYFDIREFQDEERKLNLNSLTPETYPILRRLILKLGFDEATARSVAASVLDWIDPDDEATDPPFGAEEEYYRQTQQPYHCKNLAFDSLEELLLVKGMTPELYEQLKDYVTVFPKKPSQLWVNINTASPLVIAALMEHFSGPLTNTGLSDAESLTEKILRWRSGEDGKAATRDDRLVVRNDLPLNAKEEALYRAVEKYLTPVSRYIRLEVQGVDASSGAASHIEAVVEREHLAIVFWRRD